MPPTAAVADAEPAPLALDVARVGLDLMVLLLAVPKGRAPAEAMARKMGAVIDDRRAEAAVLGAG